MKSSWRSVVGMLALLLLAGPLARLAVADAGPRSWLFVSLLRAKKIVTFARDPNSGALTRLRETACPAEPACQAVSTDRKTLYVSFRSTGQLASYRIDPVKGSLRLLNVVAGGADPAFLWPDRKGRFLIAAYYQANKVTVHRLRPGGALDASPVQTILTAAKAHGVAVDSRQRWAYVPHTGANRIYQFRILPERPRLVPLDPPFLETPARDHPRHLVLHPSDRWAYASNEAGDSIGVFAIRPRVGTLRRIQTVSTLPDGFDGNRNATARCEITPSGRYVYIANRGHDSIAGFAVDSQTGRVRRIGITPTEKTPRSLTISSDGNFLYVAGQSSGKIATYRIGSGGSLKRIATVASGPVSWWVLAVDSPGQ